MERRDCIAKRTRSQHRLPPPPPTGNERGSQLNPIYVSEEEQEIQESGEEEDFRAEPNNQMYHCVDHRTRSYLARPPPPPPTWNQPGGSASNPINLEEDESEEEEEEPNDHLKEEEEEEGEEEEEEEECPICFEDVKDGLEPPTCVPCCSHLFHKHCLVEWFRERTTCPLCRSSSNSLIAFRLMILH